MTKKLPFSGTAEPGLKPIFKGNKIFCQPCSLSPPTCRIGIRCCKILSLGFRIPCKAVADNYKPEITKYAQDYYKNPILTKRLPGSCRHPTLTSAGEIWTKAGANFQHMWLSLHNRPLYPTKLIEFINAVHPEATPEARTAMIKQVMSETVNNVLILLVSLQRRSSP